MAILQKNYDPAMRAGAISSAMQSVAKSTNGTTPVDIFGTINGFAGTITSLLFVAEDDANGTIEVYSDTGTLARITTKGSLGTVKGTPLSNTSFTATGTLKAVNVNGTGNVKVIATFTVS